MEILHLLVAKKLKWSEVDKMNNKKQIEKVLNELNIIYKEEEVAQNGFSVDTYLIHFVANNVIFLEVCLMEGLMTISI